MVPTPSCPLPNLLICQLCHFTPFNAGNTMQGRQHFTLSLATAAIWVGPELNDLSPGNWLLLGGVALGSLIPDVDARKAAIFNNQKGPFHPFLDWLFRMGIGWVFPLFGYFTKYLIHVPLVLVLKGLMPAGGPALKHRGFAHSLWGLMGFTGLTGLYFWLGFQWLSIPAGSLLVPFLTGYFAGGFLHLLQDSCTRQGIVWFQPLSSLKIAGTLQTPQSSWRPAMLLLALLGLGIGSYYWEPIGDGSWQKPLAIAASAGMWVLFLWLVGVRVFRS